MTAAPRVLVVGAGPAGLATAIALGTQGVRALVVDRATEPPLKPGECLPPSTGPILARLGVPLDPAVHPRCPAFSADWSSAGAVTRHFLFDSAGEGWIIDRPSFEEQLAARARALGATVRRGSRLLGLTRVEEGWRASLHRSGETVSVEVDVVVDASGRSGVVGRLLGVARERGRRLVATWAHAPATDSTQVVQIAVAPDGWWYAVGLPDGRRSVAFFGDAPLHDPEQFVQRAPAGFGLAEAPDRLRVSPAESSWLTSPCGAGWFAVGDAALTFDPLASQGIRFALSSAWYCAQAITSLARGETAAPDAYRALVANHGEAYRAARADIYAACRFADQPFWREQGEPSEGSSAGQPPVIIPAAGLGTRLAPLTDTTPKELLPLGGQPAIHGALLEAQAAGVHDVVVVASPGKPALEDWVRAEDAGGGWAFRLHLAHQPQPAGVLDAVERGRAVLGHPTRYVVLFPDYVQLPRQDGLAALLARSHGQPGTWFGLIRRTPERAARMGSTAAVTTEPQAGGHRIVALGAPGEAPLHTTFAEVRCAEHQRRIDAGPLRDERVGSILSELARDGLLFGVELPGELLDLGVRPGYDHAVARFADGARWRPPGG